MTFCALGSDNFRPYCSAMLEAGTGLDGQFSSLRRRARLEYPRGWLYATYGLILALLTRMLAVTIRQGKCITVKVYKVRGKDATFCLAYLAVAPKWP